MSSLFAGIDLGGTKIHAALGDAEGRIVVETRIPTHSHEGPAAVLARMADCVLRLAAEAGATVVAAGVGAPGLLDPATGVTKFFPNLPTQWREVPAAATLAAALGCPVYLLNDARAITFGELVFGAGRTASTLAVFAIGTGVGGGVVVEGRLRLGPLGAAGELGHQTVALEGPLCGCGNRGCLETVASGPAIAAQGVRLLLGGRAPRLHARTGGDAARVNPLEMAAAAAEGDDAVADALDSAARAIGLAAANVVTALHPEAIVLAGGVAALGETLAGPVRETIRARVRMFPADGVRVEISLLGERAGVLGGIALAARSGRAER